MNARRSRIERPAARRYEVMPRDVEILHAVGRMAQATTGQLRHLFFRRREHGLATAREARCAPTLGGSRV